MRNLTTEELVHVYGAGGKGSSCAPRKNSCGGSGHGGSKGRSKHGGSKGGSKHGGSKGRKSHCS
jgi:hypothetical protein